MGYNVWVQFGLDDIDVLRDKKRRDAFCEELFEAVLSDSDESIRGNYIQTIHKRHADTPVLMFAHQNSFMEVVDYEPAFSKTHNIRNKGIFYWAYLPSMKIIQRIVKGYTELMMNLKKELGPEDKS